MSAVSVSPKVVRLGLRAAVALVVGLGAVAAAASAASAATPVFPATDSAPDAATVKKLVVGDNQTMVGPPFRTQAHITLTGVTYRLVDTDDGSGHAAKFSITSAGQIIRCTGNMMPNPTCRSATSQGIYKVTVQASDDGFDSDNSDTGSVEVTIRVTSGGRPLVEDTWVRSFMIGGAWSSPYSSNFDLFGRSVAVTDEIVVVGAENYVRNGTGVGAALVFDADDGNFLARLDSPNGEGGGFFGWEVDAAGDTVVVAARGENDLAGRVYIYNKPAGGWDGIISTAAATLQPGTDVTGRATALKGVKFGWGLSMSKDGNTIVVGARDWELAAHPYDATAGGTPDVGSTNNKLDRDGAVFVFTKPSSGWADATTCNSSDTNCDVAMLTGGWDTSTGRSRAYQYMSLGSNVSISGDGGTIAAAAPFGDRAEGYVFVYTKPSSGWADTGANEVVPRLTVTDRFANQRLGEKGVDLSDDGATLVAGASGAHVKGSTNVNVGDPATPDDYYGAAYVFTRPAGGWADGTEAAKLSTAFGHKYDLFGGGTAISGSGRVIAVANPQSRASNYRGSVHVYTRPAGGWVDITDGDPDDPNNGSVRILTHAMNNVGITHLDRYGFGGKGLAFLGDTRLAVGQTAYIWALHINDRLASLPTNGLYTQNIKQTTSNTPPGSAYLFRLQPRPVPPSRPPVQPPPSRPPVQPPPEPEQPEPETPEPEEPETPEPEEPEAPVFEDVDEGSVHAPAIADAAGLGITRGTSARTFSPDEPVSRAQMATFVARSWTAAGRECPASGGGSFDDVAAGSAHAAGVGCVAALGVARGTSARTFSPEAPVTRAQMALFLSRSWTAAGRECPASGGGSFDDVPADAAYAEAVACISALGVTRGTSAQMFSPGAVVTRAQMATFLTRFHAALTG